MSLRIETWNPESTDAADQLASVLSLHKASRSTLGPMPDRAFRDRAKHDGLLVGYLGDEIVAYVLYDIPRHNLIKIVHLCVDPRARRSGMARALVDHAIGLNPHRSMITAACRTDYGLDDFWRSLGMHIASERPGRALNGSILANWVKRINIAEGLDLLEAASLQSGLPVAVLDTNIVGDLFMPSDVRRDHREETIELNADWLQPLVSFALSAEVDNEISQNDNIAMRRRIRDATTHLTRLSTRRPADRALEDELLSAIDPSMLQKDASLQRDVLHVADAIHAGADYFVTNDGNVIEAASNWVAITRGLRVLRPHELVRTLAPASFMSDFRSSLIDGSDLEWIRINESDDSLEAPFRVYDLEHKPADFHRRMRELLARPNSVRIEKLVDRDERLWALAAYEQTGNTLQLRLLRPIRGERGTTVAFQLLRHFRRVAWARNLSSVEVSDSAISATLDAALRADGFTDGPRRVAELGPAHATASALGVEKPAEVVITERNRWPLVLTEARLPTYLIPIRPAWASRLLGIDDGLFSDRRRGLGLSRELVYFSATQTTPRPLPARVLWYMSGDDTIEVRQIVARSVLIDASRIDASDAVDRFARLGVLRASEIEDTADKTGKVSVIRFQDTEVLTQPVSRHDAVFLKYVKGRVHSMRSVAPEFFDEILARQFSASSVE